MFINKKIGLGLIITFALFAIFLSYQISLAQVPCAPGYTLSTNPDGSTTCVPSSNSSGAAVSFNFSSGLNCSTVTQCLGNLASALAAIAQVVFPVMILVGGIIVMTSTGKPELYGKGIQTIVFGSLGFLITLVGGQMPAIITAISGGNAPSIFTSVFGAIQRTLSNLAQIVIPIMVLIGGYLIVVAADNAERLEKGRNILTWALIGFIIVLVYPAIIQVVVDIAGGQAATGFSPTGTLYAILNAVKTTLIDLGIPVASVIIALGGYFVLASGDNAERRSKGAKFIGWGAVGLLIILIYNTIIGAVQSVATGTFTTTALYNAITQIASSVIGLGVPVAAVIILVGAYFVLISGDNPERRSRGWKYIGWGAVGLLLLGLIGLIIALAQSLVPGAATSFYQLIYDNIRPIWYNIAYAMTAAGIPAVTIVFILAGYHYMTSGGETEKTTKARRYLMWGVIGVVLIVIANTLAFTLNVLVGQAAPQGTLPGTLPSQTPSQSPNIYCPPNNPSCTP